jgi:hypothetical protein
MFGIESQLFGVFHISVFYQAFPPSRAPGGHFEYKHGKKPFCLQKTSIFVQ